MRIKRILLRSMLFALLIIGSIMNVYAEHQYANLTFFWDGEEVLTKTISTKKLYKFPDPNKYMKIDPDRFDLETDEEGNVIGEIPEINALGWVEINDDGERINNICYHTNDEKDFSAGDHYFRILTDNPEYTEESIMFTDDDTHAYLVFYSEDGEEIIEEKEIMGKHGSDPGQTWEVPKIDLGDKATMWYMFNEDTGDEAYYPPGLTDAPALEPGLYEFYLLTDDPVTFTFYYPKDGDNGLSWYNNEKEEGGMCTTITGSPITKNEDGSVTGNGTIRLPGQTGCCLEEGMFEGWQIENEISEDYNYILDMFGDYDKTYEAHDTYYIKANTDLRFRAVYRDAEDEELDEENEQMYWENQPDEAAGENANFGEKTIINIELLNQVAGQAFGAYIDENGVSQRSSGGGYKNDRYKSNYTLSDGTPVSGGGKGYFVKRDDLTSLKKDGDPKNPADYEYDVEGRPAAESNLTGSLSGVLRQDDSAMYMDLFGNSFIWHDEYTRLEDMALAYARYIYWMPDNYAQALYDWDDNIRISQEAIELALLSGEYPGKPNSIYSQFNANTPEAKAAKAKVGLSEDIKIPEWDNKYLSETAFNKLLYTKMIWKGWPDGMTDGLEDGLKRNVNVVGDANSNGKSFFNLFGITAYASENEDEDKNKNDMGIGNQYGARVGRTLDIENQKFRAIYINFNEIDLRNKASFAGLEGITSRQSKLLYDLHDEIVKIGVTDTMANAICGNAWYDMKEAKETDTKWEDLLNSVIQDGKLKNQDEVDKYLKEYGGNKTVETIGLNATGDDDAKSALSIACEAWYINTYDNVNCVTDDTGALHSDHSANDCGFANNGTQYIKLKKRKEYVIKMWNSSNVSSKGSMTEAEINEVLNMLPDGTSIERKEVVKTALEVAGAIPYCWGGEASSPGWEGVPKKGLDCSHFVDWVYWTATGDNLGNSNTDTLVTKGNAASSPSPGDVCLRWKQGDNGKNHVIIFICALDNGQAYYVQEGGGRGNLKYGAKGNVNVVANGMPYYSSYYHIRSILN